MYFRKKAGGGIKFTPTCTLTKLGDDPDETVKRILHEYKLHNAEVIVREDITTDQLIDVIEGNRKYIRCLYAYNKIDTVTIEDVDVLAHNPHSVVIGVNMRLNIDYLLEKMWEYLGLVRRACAPVRPPL